MASRISTFFVLVGVVATCFAQQQCGCQQQPTVIQLSCGNGGQGPIRPPQGHPLPQPTPPPPAFQEPTSTVAYPSEPEPSAEPPAAWEPSVEPPADGDSPAEEHRWSMHEDMDRHSCTFDAEGYPNDYNGIYYGDLRFPDGFRIDWENNEAEVPAGLPIPPKNWDGYPETLGFPMPEKGTELYNMLLCFPYGQSVSVATTTRYILP